MPLLTLFASLAGITGGTFVGMAMLEASLLQYVSQTINAVGLNSLFGGLFKSVVYGILVAIAGCQQGMRQQRTGLGPVHHQGGGHGYRFNCGERLVLTVIYINLGI